MFAQVVQEDPSVLSRVEETMEVLFELLGMNNTEVDQGHEVGLVLCQQGSGREILEIL